MYGIHWGLRSKSGCVGAHFFGGAPAQAPGLDCPRWRSKRAAAAAPFGTLTHARTAPLTVGTHNSEGQLEAHVRRFEAKTLIEPVCCDPGRVGRQLNQPCATPAPFSDRPGNHRPSQTVAPKVRPDSYCLDLQSRSSASGEPGNESQLHGGNHFIFGRNNNEKKLRRVRINCLESKIVGTPVFDCDGWSAAFD